MMLRLILVTCMTSSVLSIPLHQLFRRSLVKRYGNEHYESLVNIMADQMINSVGGEALTEQETKIQLLAHGINNDTAIRLADHFFSCCDNDSDRRLSHQELRQAMHEFSILILP
ncbi:uncharacterized protein LOC110451472 [Mizuhopecten yessoensis]|uniref:EF-hand domain-containing protein n=1 Tax=Mizuhopecten yessoensis TaxID=6573 RepID=A0A210QLK3_MIZYE|nr:uncharacterized protein LOC110451472 [Mizuhopecten yessoensis]OWF49616.1 hypothetical protein KP79_PYT01035 [Mizuhopecten yessoensis]